MTAPRPPEPVTRKADLQDAVGLVGVWSRRISELRFTKAREFAQEVEALGYGAIWIPEGVDDKEALSHAALLLGATRRTVVATGIASIWARDPVATMNGARALAEAFPGRFLLGLGVSHAPEAAARGRDYQRPLSTMRAYLDAMDRAPLRAAEPAAAVSRVLAALAPRMLELARERADGSHPYFVPVAHTAFARDVLGPGPILAPEQAVVLEESPDVARRIAREYMRPYLALENYRRNLLRLGWRQADLDGGASDALVDALVAWGTTADVHARIRAHHEAGADHVCIQPLASDARSQLAQLRALAALLTETAST
jgi:probable F420-dependent oxidoreductase